MKVWVCVGLWAGLLTGIAGVALAAPPPDSPQAKQDAQRLNSLPPIVPGHVGQLDTSGRKQKGRASFYGHEFNNRTMADGRRMNPNANVAASKTLPLGSVAKVTNLQNGKSTTVRIEDRGPYVGGRIIDLTPKAAAQIDIKKQGVAPVEVKPVTLPTDGGVKLGAGAAGADPRDLRKAVETTQQLASPPDTVTAGR